VRVTRRGAARACGLPDVSGLEQRVSDGLVPAQQSVSGAVLAGRNLEQVLNRLRRISALLEGRVTGWTG